MKVNKRAGGATKSRGSTALKAQARELYRDRIIDAAEQVFVRRGLAGTRMSDVASACGLATGTLYNYFANRDALLSSLLERRLDQLVTGVQAAAASLPPKAPLAVQLQALVGASFQHFESHWALFNLVAGGGISGKAMRRCTDAQREYQAAFAAALERAAGAGLLRSDLPISIQVGFLTGAVHGMVRSWARQEPHKGAPNLVDQASAVVDLFLAGAKTR
jgi:AcrR family transcriptional regulator